MRDLRQSWRRIVPPPAGGELADQPAAVRATVATLRARWDAVQPPTNDATEAPAAAAATAFARRATRHLAHARRSRLRRRFQGLAAAATVLVSLGMGVRAFVDWPEAHHTPPSADPATVGPTELSARSKTRALDPDRPRVLLSTPDRIEMRAGSVRLVLVRPDPQPEPQHEPAGVQNR